VDIPFLWCGRLKMKFVYSCSRPWSGVTLADKRNVEGFCRVVNFGRFWLRFDAL
jgi:hypothetical protein